MTDLSYGDEAAADVMALLEQAKACANAAARTARDMASLRALYQDMQARAREQLALADELLATVRQIAKVAARRLEPALCEERAVWRRVEAQLAAGRR